MWQEMGNSLGNNTRHQQLEDLVSQLQRDQSRAASVALTQHKREEQLQQAALSNTEQLLLEQQKVHQQCSLIVLGLSAPSTAS